MPTTDGVSGTLTRHTLLTSAWWMTASNLVSQIVAYGSLILLARWLLPASFGTVAVGMAVVAIGVLIVDRGTWGAVVVERHLTRSDLAHSIRVCLATASVLAVLLAASAGMIVDRFATGGDVAAVAVVALCLPLHGMAVVPTALLQRAMQFRRLACVTGIANAASALGAVALGLGECGIWALVGRQLILFGGIALLSLVLCVPAFRSQPVGDGAVRRSRRGRTERWFFCFTITDSVNSSLDKLVIGMVGNASLVGLYSMANTIAMSPWRQFSSQIGQVLFAAAATEPETSNQRTVRSVQLMSMLMVPLIPVAVLVAPAALPSILGPEWAPMVHTFQVLIVVGIGNAVVNCIAEPLTGIGFVAFRAKVVMAQCCATLLALMVLVPVAGILGAALAQLIVFIPYALLYFIAGGRRAGTSGGELWRSIRPALWALCLQLSVTGAVWAVLTFLTVNSAITAFIAAAVGWTAALVVVRRHFAQVLA